MPRDTNPLMKKKKKIKSNANWKSFVIYEVDINVSGHDVRKEENFHSTDSKKSLNSVSSSWEASRLKKP